MTRLLHELLDSSKILERLGNMFQNMEEGDQVKLATLIDQSGLIAADHLGHSVPVSDTDGLTGILEPHGLDPFPHGERHKKARAATDIQEGKRSGARKPIAYRIEVIPFHDPFPVTAFQTGSEPAPGAPPISFRVET
jgi:hypothetical protein